MINYPWSDKSVDVLASEDCAVLYGAIATVAMPCYEGGPRRYLYVADVHNWEGGGTGYDPVCVGVFTDRRSAFGAIVTRARQYGAQGAPTAA